MRDYRIRIRLLSALGTPWQSDTVFGHLAWQVALGGADLPIEEFLDPFREGRPPFVLSDGFPQDYLPRPLLPVSFEGDLTAEEYAANKARRKARFVTSDDFQAMRRGQSTAWEPVAEPWQTLEIPHAAINRRTETTGSGEEGEGGHFFTTPLRALSTGSIISVYLRAEEQWAQWVSEMLADMAPLGFGRDRSTGAGAYELIDTEPFEGFADLPGASGFVSLSSYVPAGGDPTEGYWRIRIKRGKLGEHGGGGNPFKRPLVQMEPGAVFHTDSSPQPYYGRAVAGLAPGMPEAIQCCYTLAVPIVLDHE